MIVDDERPLVNIAEEMLAGLGYEPAGFSSSRGRARGVPRRTRPLRHRLDGRNDAGPDRHRPGARDPPPACRHPHRPQSGYSGPQLTERARSAGVSDILRKPLVSRDIAEALARHLRARLTDGER
jgi:CheY-like chemotaxis protein